MWKRIKVYFKNYFKNYHILHLRACDFKNTRYVMPHNCAISKALRREFNSDTASEDGNVSSVNINNTIKLFRHAEYGPETFKKDRKKADRFNYSDKVIRIIILKPF
jgi:hypothetical protein